MYTGPININLLNFFKQFELIFSDFLTFPPEVSSFLPLKGKSLVLVSYSKEGENWWSQSLPVCSFY